MQETTRILGRLGGRVVERIYPDMPHTVNDDEMEHARRLAEAVGAVAGGAA